MNITTLITRRSARASVAFAMAAAVLLGASACGSEHASDQKPNAVPNHATHDTSPADTSEQLVDGAKKRYSNDGRPPGDAQENPLLAPDGRPVPLPGQNG